ncbi:MAG: biotin transport system ATP-binding protein [Candidatus Tokpelaia sp. JSC161]|nr:MAG: biotin transport system ATP-binding protein [Candidatus Tokpelaia sp. JSC161]
MNENHITLQDVSVAFNTHTVLHNLNLSLNERRIAVIGANGSGKSTFIRLLNGLVIPNKGKVTVDGLDTKTHGKRLRRKTGFVFQNSDNQIIMPTVEEDIAFGLKNLGIDKEEIEQRIQKTLREYGLLSLRQQVAHLLSGGQKQLLAICSVLVMEPDIIILDEPTTQLDLSNQIRIRKIIHQLKQRVIMTSHDFSLIERFERVLVLHQGRVICDTGPSAAIAFYKKLMT